MKQYEIVAQDVLDEFKEDGHSQIFRGYANKQEAIEAGQRRVQQGGVLYVCEVHYRVVAKIQGVVTSNVTVIEE